MTPKLRIQRFKFIQVMNEEKGRVRQKDAFLLVIPNCEHGDVLLTPQQARALVDSGHAEAVDSATEQRMYEIRQASLKRRLKKKAKLEKLDEPTAVIDKLE